MIEQSTQEKVNKREEQSISFDGLKIEVAKVIVGQEETVHFIIIALLCNGHILLEGVPGVAKTTIIKTFAQALGLDFSRIQFTPDMLPADIIGTLMYNQKTQDFETKKGPIFTNMILADEINRAPAKVQSALLEAMQEHQVTIGSKSFILDEPFLVFATQNPVEQEGTYQLPEAQLDRFMFKMKVGYLTKEQETLIASSDFSMQQIRCVLEKKELFFAQKTVKAVYIDKKIISYIVDIVFATRDPYAYKLNSIAEYIQFGVSPRATLALNAAAKAQAFLSGRDFVIPEDVRHVVKQILRHRLLLTYQAEAEGISTDDIIQKIIDIVPSP